MTSWKDLIALIVGFALSVIAGLIGALIQRRIDRRAERKPLNQLLNFGEDELLFCFAHREEMPGAILPRTSTEDFLAMNNFISALLNIGWNKKIGVRDPGRISLSDRKKNLVIICSPKSNSFAEEFQKEMQQCGLRLFLFKQDDKDDKEWYITDGHAKYYSESYKQEKCYRQQNICPHDFPSRVFEDYAVITKLTNPWNGKNKIIHVAGIRGIGTWGAAECIKKRWRQIYDRLPEKHKDSDFSSCIRVKYDNCDITEIEVIDVRMIMPISRQQPHT